MRTMPFRPANEISQSYNDGVVSIFRVENGAAPGYKPQPVASFQGLLRYEERALGIQRAYLGKQNRVKIERVLRVPKSFAISSQDVAITEDGQQYRIDLVQTVMGAYPPSVDLTLTKNTKKLDIRQEEAGGDDMV